MSKVVDVEIREVEYKTRPSKLQFRVRIDDRYFDGMYGEVGEVWWDKWRDVENVKYEDTNKE